MGVYLYAVCAADTAVVPAEGPPGNRLRLVVADGLAALVGDDPATPREPSVEDLWEHERVVEGLMGSCDVLPARFGSELEDSDAVVRLLRGRREELAGGLRRVSGAVELAVRAQIPAAPDSTPLVDPADERAGTAYMAAAAAREHSAQVMADTIHSRLADLAREGGLRATMKPAPGCAGAYLVPRDRTAAFCAAVQRLDDELGDAEITCTGPWPPYSFLHPPGDEA